MNAPLSDLLFNDYRRKVLGLLLLHPEEAYHVREIARLTNTNAGTLHRELSKLAEGGILLKSSRGNQVSYQANRDGIIFNELASILRKTSGVADVLKDALQPVANQINVALVFGSVASGKATTGSDIDLLIVGSLDYTSAVSALYHAQDILGREINPKLYTASEWKAAIKKNSAFIREILEQPVIQVIGDISDPG